ncbi:MAG: aminoacyl-tRNA hydrolase, partial [Aequorivita sp.]|nr:aminoacyl-tRNA hydrolase [Aequorivita sp.]
MNTEKLISELSFKAIRSSGPGGQHVNKTASKVEVSFNLETSEALSETEKERLRNKLSSKISS